MGMVKVFWFGSEFLRSPRTGIRPRNFVKYDERIATELVRQFGDLIMISTTEDKITHLGSGVNPAEVIHFFPVFKTQLEKMVARKIVPSLPAPVKQRIEPAQPQPTIQRQPRPTPARPPAIVDRPTQPPKMDERVSVVKSPEPKLPEPVCLIANHDENPVIISIADFLSIPASNASEINATQVEVLKEKKKRGRKKKSETEQVDQTE